MRRSIDDPSLRSGDLSPLKRKRMRPLGRILFAISLLQAMQVIGSPLRMGGSCKDRALVILQGMKCRLVRIEGDRTEDVITVFEVIKQVLWLRLSFIDDIV